MTMKALLDHSILGAAAATAVALAATGAFAQQNQQTVAGQEEFMHSCASCHGEDGRGGGPVADVIDADIPDLTTIQERNGGEFPFVRVFQIIDGRADVRGHGGDKMPVWGNRYSVDVGPDYDPTDPAAAKNVVRGRIISLANYLWTIQEPKNEEDYLIP